MKNKTTDNKTKTNVLISIDKDLWTRFKPIAAKYHRKYSSVVEESVQRWVNSKS